MNKKHPGPGSYHPKDPHYIKKNPLKEIQQFGSIAKRESLIMRDAERSPFMDPTSKKSPSPNSY